MTRSGHRLYLSALVAFVAITLILLAYRGYSYYNVKFEERFYHIDHAILKPSGEYGHGFGVAGSLCLIAGISSYMARKRYRALSRLGTLKYWLEFHIFLCTLGPVLIVFHTSFKIGGLVAVSFWSMVIVFLSGIVGRFIYIQIPHSIEGRELNLKEVQEMKRDIAENIKKSHDLNEENYRTLTESLKNKIQLYNKNPFVRFIKKYYESRKKIWTVRHILKLISLPESEYKRVRSLIIEDIRLTLRIEQLSTMQNMFKYWHVVHLPFAFVMLLIMLVHIGVAVLFGYRWIF